MRMSEDNQALIEAFTRLELATHVLEREHRILVHALRFYADNANYLRSVDDPMHPGEPFTPAEVDGGGRARSALSALLPTTPSGTPVASG